MTLEELCEYGLNIEITEMSDEDYENLDSRKDAYDTGRDDGFNDGILFMTQK